MMRCPRKSKTYDCHVMFTAVESSQRITNLDDLRCHRFNLVRVVEVKTSAVQPVAFAMESVSGRRRTEVKKLGSVLKQSNESSDYNLNRALSGEQVIEMKRG